MSIPSTKFASFVFPCSLASSPVLSTSITLSSTGLGFEISSCSFADRRSVRASCAGPKILARRAALLRFRVDARALLAMVKMFWSCDELSLRDCISKSSNYRIASEVDCRSENYELQWGISRGKIGRERPATTSLHCGVVFVYELSRFDCKTGAFSNVLYLVYDDDLCLEYEGHSCPCLLCLQILSLSDLHMVRTKMASSIDLRSLEARIKLLLNAQLKGILRGQGLAVSGIKTELQLRLLARKAAPSVRLIVESDADGLDLNKLAASGDTARIDRIRNLVNNSGDVPSSPIHNNTPPSSSSPHRPHSVPQQHPPSSHNIMPTNASFTSGNTIMCETHFDLADCSAGRIHYKTSPFFDIVQPLTAVVECKRWSNFSIRKKDTG